MAGKSTKPAKPAVTLRPEPRGELAGQPLDHLVDQLRHLIADARRRALRAVDVIKVKTCWEIGRHIVEFEQGGQERATYGKGLLTNLASQLMAEFGKGFDERNLRHMRAFFQCFPIWNAVRSELSWTYCRVLTRVKDETARHWNTRALERQICTMCSRHSGASRNPVRRVDYPKAPSDELPGFRRSPE